MPSLPCCLTPTLSRSSARSRYAAPESQSHQDSPDGLLSHPVWNLSPKIIARKGGLHKSRESCLATVDWGQYGCNFSLWGTLTAMHEALATYCALSSTCFPNVPFCPTWKSIICTEAGLSLSGCTVMQSPRLRADATARVAAAVAAAYDAVHFAVADSTSGYAGQPGFEAALEHSPDHVRTILGVLG